MSEPDVILDFDATVAKLHTWQGQHVSVYVTPLQDDSENVLMVATDGVMGAVTPLELPAGVEGVVIPVGEPRPNIHNCSEPACIYMGRATHVRTALTCSVPRTSESLLIEFDSGFCIQMSLRDADEA